MFSPKNKTRRSLDVIEILYKSTEGISKKKWNLRLKLTLKAL